MLTPLDTPESSFHAGYEFSTPLGVAPGPGADAMAMPCESRLNIESWGTRFEGCRVIYGTIHFTQADTRSYKPGGGARGRPRGATQGEANHSDLSGPLVTVWGQSAVLPCPVRSVARYVGTGAPQHARTPGASWPLSQACAWQDLLGTYEQCIRTWAQSLRNLRRRHAHADLKKSHASP